MENSEYLHRPVTDFMRRDFVSVRPDWTVTQCLESLRGEQETGGIFYIYVTDETNALKGVIPIRRMLAVDPATYVRDIMIGDLISIPTSMNISEASNLFLEHKLLAFPVVDEANHLLGIVDVNVFTDDVIDTSKPQKVDDVFQWIGVRMEVIKNASPLRAFRFRIPWLGATIGSGLACAGVARLFEATLAEAAILAMFLTLALGLGESVSIQSMTMTMQALQGQQASLKDFVMERLKKELQTAGLLALTCGAVVGLVSLLWPGHWIMSVAIGVSIASTIVVAGLTGLAVPAILHKLERDPRVAAGPITLAIADIATVFLYLGAGTIALWTT